MNSQSPRSRLQFVSYAALFTSIGFGIVGQLLMKYTMSHTGEGLLTWPFIQKLVIALTTYSLGIVNWIFALRVVKLSIAYPLTSLNYVGILLGSYYFFGEKITLIRVVGVALIFSGVLLVALPITNRQQR
ncbi:EamA family transporter [Aetokthonos hydrillicola Thurmond2011]|uniref:EamA family transporter n=1 Tax=Aetokthonos hydrillicola Thurmond2011 TaxID=2712845 RepID=A0AAP5I4H0_9CYAN|nr:EamA family transporter [Aetokthonos hydrillicola]MBO3462942.1 EamA family transporter [Aetokthonos hydrillicola CCALA 1050]MBW4585686.1 EamA family transporter [Aetokthonos hydrillicola CCALA 1050]MDR9894586.1 EamA family transporter [Aetokthonos hydrillicola Thurmond2011]